RFSQEHLEIHLRSSHHRLLAGYSKKGSYYAEKLLRERGVQLHLGNNQRKIPPYDAFIADKNSYAPVLFRECGLALDTQGWVVVNPHLRSISNDSLYAVGRSSTVQGL